MQRTTSEPKNRPDIDQMPIQPRLEIVKINPTDKISEDVIRQIISRIIQIDTNLPDITSKDRPSEPN